MELAQIRYFFAVCEARHFTRAARQCGISQPSLSNAIRRLEEEFGGPLFDRGPPVALSALGESVKPHFIAILREVDSIHRLFGPFAFKPDAAHSNGGMSERRVRVTSAQADDG